MSPILAQRQLSLGAAAVLGVVVALALAARDNPAPRAASRLPRPAVSDLSGWYSALAGVRTRPLAGKPSGCGTLLSPKTLGVDHPVLPCGAKIFVSYDGKTVLTTIVDRGPYGPGHEFEVTPALADLLHLSGVQTIRWSFARAD
jgi:rare lipoprotein A (RlpA)-like double-psi beta-barrel protein